MEWSLDLSSRLLSSTSFGPVVAGNPEAIHYIRLRNDSGKGELRIRDGPLLDIGIALSWGYSITPTESEEETERF